MVLHSHMSPPRINRFDLNNEPPASNEYGKKRKLQYYSNIILPLSKYKFRVRYYKSDDDSSIDDPIDIKEHATLLTSAGAWNKYDENEGIELDYYGESFMGSNNFDGMDDSVMIVDSGSIITASFVRETHHDHPSTSSSSCNTVIRPSCSLDANEEVEEESHFDEDLLHYKEQLYEFEAYGNLLCSEIESNVIDKCIGAETNDSIYPSHVLTSDLITQSLDGKVVHGKPTIDQEFEEYFSMLML